MRLWHYKLIPALPQKQLISQWRECVAIAKGLKEDGKTNHILINKVMNYPLDEFRDYCLLVYAEMQKRNYTIAKVVLEKMFNYINFDFRNEPKTKELFKGWHNDRYFRQCYYNLEEKYDCGGISEKEWNSIFGAMMINSGIAQKAIAAGICTIEP